MNKCSYFLCALALVLGPALAGSKLPKRITGIYSGIVQSKESGDIDGMEMLIIPANESSIDSYAAFVQVAEGSAPYTATVSIHLANNRIEFELPQNGSARADHLVGTFNGAELVVRSSDGRVYRLKRGRSFWQ